MPIGNTKPKASWMRVWLVKHTHWGVAKIFHTPITIKVMCRAMMNPIGSSVAALDSNTDGSRLWECPTAPCSCSCSSMLPRPLFEGKGKIRFHAGITKSVAIPTALFHKKSNGVLSIQVPGSANGSFIYRHVLLVAKSKTASFRIGKQTEKEYMVITAEKLVPERIVSSRQVPTAYCNSTP